MTKKHQLERRRRHAQLAAIDQAHRCGYCKAPLPRLGALIAELSGNTRYCSDGCLEDALTAAASTSKPRTFTKVGR